MLPVKPVVLGACLADLDYLHVYNELEPETVCFVKFVYNFVDFVNNKVTW